MTDKQLRERCAFWQKVLRLQDWRIDVRFADSAETDGEEGTCQPFQNSKLAVIRVARPEALDQTGEFYKAFPEEHDPEAILLHELLHIPFDSLFNHDADKHEETMQEQTIDFIAQALIALERG